MTQTLASTVGLNSANRSSDVLVVQALLNGIPASLGGPTTPLELDGLFGDDTAHAISAFQMKQFGWADCVVSPGQVTLQKLNALSRHADANIVVTLRAIISCIRYLGQVPGVYASYGAQYALLRNQSARIAPAILLASGPETEAGIGGVSPIFGDVLPFPFPRPPPAGAGAGAGPGLIFLVLALLAYIIANRPPVFPQTDADKILERDLTELEKLTIMLSIAQAKEVQKQVKAEVKAIEDCSDQRLDRIVVGGKCATLFELYKKAAADVLRKLNTYITSGNKFPGLLNAINAALIDYNKLLKALKECLECEKLGQERIRFRRAEFTARPRGWTRQASCGIVRDCLSCPQDYLADILLHQPP